MEKGVVPKGSEGGVDGVAQINADKLASLSTSHVVCDAGDASTDLENALSLDWPIAEVKKEVHYLVERLRFEIPVRLAVPAIFGPFRRECAKDFLLAWR
jgi:hypothetical protein